MKCLLLVIITFLLSFFLNGQELFTELLQFNQVQVETKKDTIVYPGLATIAYSIGPYKDLFIIFPDGLPMYLTLDKILKETPSQFKARYHDFKGHHVELFYTSWPNISLRYNNGNTIHFQSLIKESEL